MNDLERFRIHAFYIIAILVACLILAITVQWGSIKDLVSYIAFALTLSSLILSIFAIFQGLLSSSSLHDSISLIQDASEKVVSNAERIDTATRNLTEQVKDVPALMSGVKEELRSHSELLQKVNHTQASPLPATASTMIENFLEQSSIAGLVILYAVVKSYETKKTFNILEISDSLTFTTVQYSLGYIVASCAFGLFDYNSEKMKENIMEVRSIDSSFQNNFHRVFASRYEKYIQQGQFGFTKAHIAQVDDYLAKR